jgi:protein-tyrosine phosphatase
MEEKNNYETLRDLLLNDYDNNMFLTPQHFYIYNDKDKSHSYYNVVGIRKLHCFSDIEKKEDLFLGVKKIYIIFKDISEKSRYQYNFIPIYIKNSGIPIEPFICNLDEFLILYPEFANNKYYLNNIKFLDWAYSRKSSNNGIIYNKTFYCENLPACYILPNLIVGEKLNFTNIKELKFNQISKNILNLKNNNITCIINVSDDCISDYDDDTIKCLNDENIEFYNFPISEYNNEHNNDAKDKMHKVADLLNEKFSNNSNNKIYLHCLLGKNRSASCAILYMVKYMNMTLKDAFLNILLKRHIFPQIELLRIIYDEATIKEQNPIALHKLISEKYLFPIPSSAYDIYMLDIIANRQRKILINNYNI